MLLAAVLVTASSLWRQCPRSLDDHRAQLRAGSAGAIFWTDIVIPVIGIILLWFQRQYEMQGALCSALPFALPNLRLAFRHGPYMRASGQPLHVRLVDF